MGKKNHKAAPWMCGQCKQGFESERSVRDHIKNAHPLIHQCGIFRLHGKQNGKDYDDEPSFADRAIEARIAMMSGLPTDDAWLLGE